MHPAVWQCEPAAARLTLGPLSALLDATHPADGLTEISFGGDRCPGASLLGIAGPMLAAESGTLVDHFARGGDLALAYEDPSPHPTRVDATWRAVSPAAGEEFLAAVDLIVSVRTESWEGRPELTVQSLLPATDVQRLVSAADDEFAPLLPPRDRLVMEPASGPGCLVFRLSGLSLSYIEMVHPADFRHDELMPGPARGALRLEHRLFPQTLEKGVILRARVRGAFVPRADDLRIAAESYRAFASAEPPLGG